MFLVIVCHAELFNIICQAPLAHRDFKLRLMKLEGGKRRCQEICTVVSLLTSALKIKII